MVFAVLGLLCARTSTQGSLAPQRVCLFSFPSPAASAALEGFQPKRGDGHSHRTHVADHIQPHSPAQYGRQCSQPTVRHRASTQSLLATLPRQRLSAFRCSAHLNPQALRRPRTQPHKSALANAPSPARHLPSPAPNHPPVGRALGCLPVLS